MKAERDIIMRKSVQDIQSFCSEYGLHFQLVDMPWPEEVEKVANRIHQQEIANCQNLSIGPNFIVRVKKLLS